MLRGGELMDSFMFAIALAVAAIPEALSSIVTIVLSFGTQKMSKENAIINMVPEVIDKITDFLGRKSDDEDEDVE